MKKILYHPLFFYGTLRSGDVRKAVLGKLQFKLKYSSAFIIGFKLFKVIHTNYPLIIFNEHFKEPINGILVHGINFSILKKLDLFEGENYSRKKIEVFQSKDNNKISAEIYMPNKLLNYSKPWIYEDWEKFNKSDFFKIDFNKNGILAPK